MKLVRFWKTNGEIMVCWQAQMKFFFFQFQACPGNKERNTNPQVEGGVTSEGEFGYGHVKTVLMDMNKDIFTSAQHKGKWKWLAPASSQTTRRYNGS